MVQFLSINFFSWISSILLGFSEVPVFLCHPVWDCYTSSGIGSIKPVLAYPEILPIMDWACDRTRGTGSIPPALAHPKVLPITDWDCIMSSGTCSIPPDWDCVMSSGTSRIPHVQYFYFLIHSLRNIAVNIDKIHILLIHKLLVLYVFINIHAVFNISFGPIVIDHNFIHYTYIFNVFVV